MVEIGEIEQAVEDLSARKVEAVAGIRQSLETIARQRPQFQVLSDLFMEIRQAVCVAKRNESAIALIEGTTAEMAISGALLDALESSGQSATIVAGRN